MNYFDLIFSHKQQHLKQLCIVCENHTWFTVHIYVKNLHTAFHIVCQALLVLIYRTYLADNTTLPVFPWALWNLLLTLGIIYSTVGFVCQAKSCIWFYIPSMSMYYIVMTADSFRSRTNITKYTINFFSDAYSKKFF